jgi:hypothetical protein
MLSVVILKVVLLNVPAPLISILEGYRSLKMMDYRFFKNKKN